MSKSLQKRPGDPRLGHLIGQGRSKARVTLIGFPFDLGVKLNFSRPGAVKAPNLIREALFKTTPDAGNFEKFTKLANATFDRGDLKLPASIPLAQAALGKEVGDALRKGTVPIILGGGHETSLGHFFGYTNIKEPVQVINLDAHPDVRERIGGVSHSGSSFRDIIEHRSKLCRGYTVLGLQPQSCALAHLKFIEKQRNSNWFSAKETSLSKISQIFSKLRGDAMVSIDMDCVDQALAPGVASPNASGLASDILLHFAFEAGRSRWVRSLDIVEVNPKYDLDNRTGRLAALAIWHFLSGMTRRKIS